MASSLFLPDPPLSTEYDTGDIICDRYHILMKNATAEGHNRVYYCLDQWDQSPCVIKEMPAFSRIEAQRLVNLPYHRNVIRLLRLEVIGGSVFTVLEWMPRTLSDMMNSIISSEEIIAIISNICSGLEHCWRYLSSENKPFYHGDLKPENIFIAGDGTAVIADFGGGYTPSFSSPEQRNGQTADIRSDIYNIGLILSLLCDHCTDHLFTQEMEFIIRWCTEDLPSDRPQSLNELTDRMNIQMDTSITSTELTTEQQFSMALIGENFNLFSALTNALKSDDAKSIYYAGEILLQYHSPENAINMFDVAYKKDQNPLALSGIARACLDLSNWEMAQKYSMMALSRNCFDYRSFHTYISAVYNQSRATVDQDHYFEFTPDRNLYLPVLEALEAVYEKQPHRKEPLRLSGFIHYILGDYEKAIPFYREYLDHSKDDYETLYYYAMCLYLTNDTTNAIEHFRITSDFLENSESVSLNRLVMLLSCKYFLRDIKAFDSILAKIENIFESLSPQELESHSDQHIKALTFYNLQSEDLEIAWDDYAFCYQISDKLKTEKSFYREWCEDALKALSEHREKWQQLPPESITARTLFLISYDCDCALYELLSDHESALSACNKMIELDKSSHSAITNKAQILVQLGRYSEAIPLLDQAIAMPKNESMKDFLIQHKEEALRHIT